MILAKVIKCSVPGFEKSFDNLHDACEELSKHICSGCLLTESEYKRMVEEIPDNQSDIVGMTIKEAWEEDMADYLMDDWVNDTCYNKIRTMLNTNCGLEMDVRFEDV